MYMAVSWLFAWLCVLTSIKYLSAILISHMSEMIPHSLCNWKWHEPGNEAATCTHIAIFFAFLFLHACVTQPYLFYLSAFSCELFINWATTKPFQLLILLLRILYYSFIYLHAQFSLPRCCGSSLDLEVPKEFDKGTPIRYVMDQLCIIECSLLTASSISLMSINYTPSGTTGRV